MKNVLTPRQKRAGLRIVEDDHTIQLVNSDWGKPIAVFSYHATAQLIRQAAEEFVKGE